MPIHRLNHAVLYIRNVAASVAFYSELLGFRVLVHIPEQMALLQAPDSTNDHDIGLFQIGEGARPSGAGRATVGLYHLAWEVDTLDDLAGLRQVMADAGALVGQSDHGGTKSLYCQDPDGLEFEIEWVVPLDAGRPTTGYTLPLDLDAEIARFGGDRQGGIGLSRPAPV